MKDPLRPGLQPVSQLKTGPTTSSTQSSTLLSPASPLVRSSPQLRVQRLSSRDDTQDSVKEKSTGDLIRRVLYPQSSSGHGASSPQPAEEVLPPLTSSNEVDHQLYAILAVIIRDFVYTWYSKITSDQALVNEVLQVIAHCTRALEQRIRQVDVTQLFLDEIPALVEVHIRSYRLSKEGSSLSGLPTSRRALYHELNPHPGLLPIPDPTDPDTVTAQAENEAVYRRLLANGTLAVLLPTEDLGNSSLRYLVGDIVSDLILGKQVGARVCQGWFLWEIIGKAADAGQRREASKGSNSPTDVGASQLDKFGLLHDEDALAKTDDNRQSRTAAWLWSILQNIYLVYLGLRFVVTGLFQVASGSKKAASRVGSVSIPAATSYVSHAESLHTWSSEGATTKIPVLDYRLYSMLSQLLCIPSRLPWLSGILALAQHMTLAGPGRIGKSDGILDRFLRQTIETYILPPSLLPNILIATRSALTPAKTWGSITPTVSGSTSAASPSAPQSPTASRVPPPASGSQATRTTGATAGVTASATEQSKGGGPIRAAGSLSDSVVSSNSNDEAGSSRPRPDSGDPSPSGRTVEVRQAAQGPVKTSPNDPSGSTPTIETPDAEHLNQNSPSAAEIAAIKRRCATSLLAVIPRSVARTLFGVHAPPGSQSARTCSDGDTDTDPDNQSKTKTSEIPSPTQTDKDDSEEAQLLQAIEEDWLDLLSDEYCNKHLVYSIVETVLARLLPELTERSVGEIMEDRGIAYGPGSSDA